MKQKIGAAVLGAALAIAVVGGSAEAGQAGGTKNCGTSWIKTQSTGYGNHVHDVAGFGHTTFFHPIGVLSSHTMKTDVSWADWEITTGGTLVTGVANCWIA